jgi:PD-(D/E)XK nuclease superfamily protein
MQKDSQSHAIIGAAIEVHRELGFGLLEAGYQCALAFEFQSQAIAELTRADDAQFINEVKATRLERGLLLNFDAPSLQFKRLVRTASENLRKSAKSADNLEEITL